MLRYTHRTPLAARANPECVEASRLVRIESQTYGATLHLEDGSYYCCAESLEELVSQYDALLRRWSMGPAGWEVPQV